MKSWFGLTPWRRATRLTEAPGSRLSSTSRIFSAALQRRRRCLEVITSTFSKVSVIRTVIPLTLTGVGDCARSIRGLLQPLSDTVARARDYREFPVWGCRMLLGELSYATPQNACDPR